MIGDEGVSSTLAYVIIFGVAFLILTTSIVVVNQMESRVIGSSNEKQLNNIGEVIRREVTETYLTSIDEGSFEKTLDIPEEVNGENYRINFSDDSIRLSLGDTYVKKEFFGLNESLELRGDGWSSSSLVIYFDGEEIVLSEK